MPWPNYIDIDTGYLPLSKMAIQCGASLYPLCTLLASEVRLATNGTINLLVENGTTTVATTASSSPSPSSLSLDIERSLSGEQSLLTISELDGIAITGADYDVRPAMHSTHG